MNSDKKTNGSNDNRKSKIVPLKTLVATVILCIGFSIISSAQGERNNDKKGPPSFSQLLKEMDKNEDGKLTKTEVKGPLKESFDKVDTNEDGFITEKEFEKAPKAKKGSKRKN
ncbi:MAG: EF-hand domain-containing protein [Bizionia sp.]|nr:EF-hand domain-containing protein [Bizionia sp.]